MRVAILAAVLPLAAHAGQIYKCEVGGRSVFQDHACEGAATDQNVYDVRQLPGAGAPPEGDASFHDWSSKLDKDTRRSDLNARIARLEKDKERLRQELGDQLVELRAQRTSASNAGDARTEQSLDAEMQELTRSYQARLQSADGQEQLLREQLAALH